MKLKDKFKQLKQQNKKAFIAYLPYCFPNKKITKDIILTLAESNVDIIELGIPFSDPLADGPIIQAATKAALDKGANIDGFFRMLKDIRGKVKVPLVVMTYYNPVYYYGVDKFLNQISKLGVSGVMIVDLPIEESGEYIKLSKKAGLENVFFVTPTTSGQRIKQIVKVSQGFIYYISVTGITGPQSLSLTGLKKHLRQIKKLSKTPVCIGFGIHKKEQVRDLSEFSDGVIIGSAIVKFIEENYKRRDFTVRLKKYIKSLR